MKSCDIHIYVLIEQTEESQQNLKNHIIRFRTLYCQKHILYLKKVIRYHKKNGS